MDALGVHFYDTLVELKKKFYYEKKLRRWWSSFSCGDQALIQELLGDATALFHTTLDWHLLEVITSFWDLALRCVNIGDVDLVPTLEEYDHFLSFSTSLSTVFFPLVRTHYCKRLTNLMGFKRPVVEALAWYGSGIGGSMSFDFLHDWFHSPECPIGYRDDFVDLEERWTSYRRRAFLVAFFGAVLFSSSSGAVSFSVLPLVSALPHGTFFIPALLSETIRSLCQETGRGRLGINMIMLFQLSRAIGGPNHMIMLFHKVGLTVQWPTISPGTQGLIVEVRSSPEDMMAFTKNSSGQRQMRQAKSNSSLHDSCATFDLMTSVGARKVTMMWGIDIPWPMHFLFFPLEA